MGVKIQSIQLFSLLILVFVSFSKCDLEAILTNSRLPTPLSGIRSIYDGDDFIYIFGGLADSENNLTSNDVHRYQISADKLVLSIASFPEGRVFGGISADRTGSILYYGGHTHSNGTSSVFKFIPTNGTLNKVADLGQMFDHGSVVINPNDPNFAFLIGGNYNDFDVHVECFNISSASGCGETIIPDGIYFVYNSAFVNAEIAYAFGDSPINRVLKLDLNSLQTQLVEGSLPWFSTPPSITTDGYYGYLIGGWRNGSTTPLNSLIKFNPLTFDHEFIHVINFPGSENIERLIQFQFPSTVYVEKLKRIYIIGGESFYTASTYQRHDEIWYIELPDPTTPVPTTTIHTTTTPHDSTAWISSTTPPNSNCTEDGIYFVPYPGDCSKYMVCFRYDLLPDVHTCAPGTLFDPVLGECNVEHLVPCEPICPNNNSLIFIPHQNNCNLYWLCVFEEIELRTCPDNMVFDPRLDSCNVKESVFCPNLCPTDAIANFPHQSDCSKYWNCVNGNPTLISCPDGELYDPLMGQCSKDQVECDKQL